MNKYLLTVFISLLGFTMVQSQEACSYTLERAQKLFDNGVIEQIPEMLAPCMNSGFTSEENLSAQKLIILCHLFDNNIGKAEEAMLSFLKKNPDYTTLATDPAEFVQLMRSYRTLPIASVGINVGVNMSNIILLQTHNTDAMANKDGSYSYSAPSFQVGAAFRRYIYNQFDVELGIAFAQNVYSFSNKKSSDFTSITYTENLNTLDIPFSVIYSVNPILKMTPYFQTGIAAKYLLSSSATIERLNNNTLKPVSSPSIDVMQLRNPLNFQALIGAGINLPFKRGFFKLEVGYRIGLKNFVNSKNRYTAVPDDVFQYYYTDNDFLFNQFNFNVGYYYKFYKPQKLGAK